MCEMKNAFPKVVRNVGTINTVQNTAVHILYKSKLVCGGNFFVELKLIVVVEGHWLVL